MRDFAFNAEEIEKAKVELASLETQEKELWVCPNPFPPGEILLIQINTDGPPPPEPHQLFRAVPDPRAHQGRARVRRIRPALRPPRLVLCIRHQGPLLSPRLSYY